GALFQSTEGAQQSGDEPQRGGDAPHAVGGEETLKAVTVQPALQRATAQVDGGQPDRQGQQVQRGHDSGQHARNSSFVSAADRPRSYVRSPSRGGLQSRSADGTSPH